MAVIAFVCAKGAPGLTTSALAINQAWPRSSLFADCDPAGGSLRPLFLAHGRDLPGGLGTLAAAARTGSLGEQLWGQLLHTSDTGEHLLLPGASDPFEAATFAGVWGPLAAAFAAMDDQDGFDVLADCGRLGAANFPQPLLDRAAVTVVVLGSSLTAVAVTRPWLARMRSLDSSSPSGHLSALVVGEGEPYSRREIFNALHVPVAAVIPRDAAAARAVGSLHPVAAPRSPFARAVHTAAHALFDLCRAQTEPQDRSATVGAGDTGS